MNNEMLKLLQHVPLLANFLTISNVIWGVMPPTPSVNKLLIGVEKGAKASSMVYMMSVSDYMGVQVSPLLPPKCQPLH